MFHGFQIRGNILNQFWSILSIDRSDISQVGFGGFDNLIEDDNCGFFFHVEAERLRMNVGFFSSLVY